MTKLLWNAALLSLLAITPIAPADEEKSRLPGANAIINAGEFPTLQAALDAVPEEGGMVRVPPGRFEIDRPLTIRGENVHLTGAGPATQIVNTNTEGLPTLQLLPPEPFDRTSRKRVNRWRIQVSDLHLVGNEKCGHGIDALWVNEIFLHGVTVTAHGGDGVRLDHCYEDPRIADCLFTYNKANGVHLIGCHDIVVSACHFEENQDALRCVDGFNLCMTGNNLDDHLANGVIIENTYGSVVSGNMIEECHGWGVILDRDCYGITLSANVIAHNGGGIDLRDAHGCAVSANTFTINSGHGLRIGPGSGRITVTGNNFSNSYLGEGKVRRAANDLEAAGLTLDHTSHIAVSGNVFSGLTTEPIVNVDSTGIVEQGNVFVPGPDSQRAAEEQ